MKHFPIYTEYCAERPTISMSAQDWLTAEPNMKHYTDDIMNEAKDFSDTAMVVLGRPGGEGATFPTNMSAVINGTYNQGLCNLQCACKLALHECNLYKQRFL